MTGAPAPAPNPSAEPIPAFRTISSGLVAVSSIGYTCGYLVLRARASALGIEPALSLVEEIYVFTGFKFALILVVAALIAILPVMVLARMASACAALLGRFAPVAAGCALAAMAILVLVQFSVLNTGDLLLGEAEGAIAQAVLGASPLGFWIMLGAVASALLLLLWLRQLWAGGGYLAYTLALITLLQLALLPILFGVFYADRKVRVYDLPPNSASRLTGDVGLIPSGGERATLLGLTAAGERRMVVVKEGDLVGIPLRSVEPLHVFAAELETRERLLHERHSDNASQSPRRSDP